MIKRIALLIGVAFVLSLVYLVLTRLSSDSLGMALGVFFGVLAGLPTALLVMASGKETPPPAQHRHDIYVVDARGLRQIEGEAQDFPLLADALAERGRDD